METLEIIVYVATAWIIVGFAMVLVLLAFGQPVYGYLPIVIAIIWPLALAWFVVALFNNLREERRR